jgi:hypothetical protein
LLSGYKYGSNLSDCEINATDLELLVNGLSFVLTVSFTSVLLLIFMSILLLLLLLLVLRGTYIEVAKVNVALLLCFTGISEVFSST